MQLMRIFLMYLTFKMGVFARDILTVDFVKLFILNEAKPTFLIFNDLCWNTNVKVKMIKDISKAGFRTTDYLDLKSEHLYQNSLFLCDLNCPNVNEVIGNATSRNLFRAPFRWLVLYDSSKNDQGLSALFESPLSTDSDLTLAKRVEDGFKMTELHRTSSTGPVISTSRGFFNGTFTDSRPHRELFRRRRDVMGHPLTMSNVIQDSNTTQFHLPKEDRLEPQFDSITKVCWMEVKLVFEMLNATPRYIFSHRWGYKQNGQWSGMVDDLHTGRADLGTNCLLNNQERLNVVTYTDMVAPFRVRFVFRQPPLSYVSNIYSLPFSRSVWAAIAGCAAISAATLCLASKWEAGRELEAGPTLLSGSFGDALLLTLSAVGQQGCVLEPRRFSGRLMTWVLFAALMLLYAAYSANIVVLLQAPSNSIRTLAQLASSKITLAANDVDYNHFVFSQYNDPDRVVIHKRIEPEKGRGQFYDINDGVERIRQGLFAFHSIVEPVYRRIEETFLEMEKCDLAEVDFMNGFDPFIPVKKDSPYLELLRVAFKQVREAGLQAALGKRYQVSKPRCGNNVSAFSSVGLLDLRPVLLFMVFGSRAAVAIAFLEMAVFAIDKRWHNKSNRMSRNKLTSSYGYRE